MLQMLILWNALFAMMMMIFRLQIHNANFFPTFNRVYSPSKYYFWNLESKTFFFHGTFEKYTSLQFKLSVQHPIEVMIFMTQTWSQKYKSSSLDILHKSCNMDYSSPLDMIAQRYFITGKRYPQDRLFCAVYE